MPFDERFCEHLATEIGSFTLPALRQYLRDRDYRLVSYTEHEDTWARDVYHPDRGFFHATGRDDTDALLGILRQIWLVESLGDAQEAGSRHAE